MIKHWLTILPISLLPLLFLNFPLQAAEQCTIERMSAVPLQNGSWLDHDNWLAPENLHLGLQSAGSFMPLLKISSSAPHMMLQTAPHQLELEEIKAVDPLDQKQQDLGFLLNTRLYADGLLVLRNGKILSEKYWNGLSEKTPRLLLGGTRPLLSLMGAIAVAQGKLSADKSIIRYVSPLSAQAGLRKLSIQRLLEGSSQFDWSAQEIDDWQAASGWKPVKDNTGIRAWLNAPERWQRDFSATPLNASDLGPDADLLAWALADSYRQPLAEIFCNNVLGKLHPEHPALWLTDPLGIELAGGLALSLRDFARLGQMLIDARNRAGRSKIPGWFIETITASRGLGKTNSANLAGLHQESESRYGFVHLGGAPNRVAILGPYGNSLYVDFDHRLVIAIFAAYPGNRNPGMQATLEQIWDTLDSAIRPTVQP